MSGRLSGAFVDFAAFSLGFDRALDGSLGLFWCETGAVDAFLTLATALTLRGEVNPNRYGASKQPGSTDAIALTSRAHWR
jgi:hypothetical protein